MALHQIKSAFTREVLFFGDFNSLRECVEAAVKAGAYLIGANLDGARLVDAELDGATIRRTKLGKRGLLKECSRSDGYRFLLFDCDDGFPRILAGCRWFTLAEARAHWTATRAGAPLGDETMDMLDMFERHIARTGDR